MIDHKYITSRSFRIKPYSASSFDCEILALRQAGRLVKSTLYDLGYRNIRMEAYCNNKPVVDTVNKNHALKKPEKIYANRAAALRSHVRTSEIELFHISGKSNPADLTVSLNSLQQQLTGEFLKEGFELIPQLKEKEIEIILAVNS